MPLNHAPTMIRELVARNAFGGEPFVLIDVGVSGGFAAHWQFFADQFVGYGFEAMVDEVARLRTVPTQGRAEYFDAFVTDDGPDAAEPHAIRDRTTGGYRRSSGRRAIEILAGDERTTRSIHELMNLNQAPETRLTGNRISLDRFVAEHDVPRVDFIKTDTDGGDLRVLHGAAGLLARGDLIGVQVETVFQGRVGPDAALFSTIDLWLRDFGFSLFDLPSFTYSRAALPAPFVYGIPAQTRSGQVEWADALYMRDFGDPDFEAKWGFAPTDTQLLKAVAVFELYGLDDCAVEILNKYEQRLAVHVDVGQLRDLAAHRASGRSYAEHLAHFEEMVRLKAFDRFPEPRPVPQAQPSPELEPALATPAQPEPAPGATALPLKQLWRRGVARVLRAVS